MDTIQALSILQPEKKSETGLKTAYRAACLKNHPDKGGDVEIMKLINVAYDFLKNSESWWTGEQSRAAKKQTPLTETFKGMVDKIKTIPGLKIEIIGSWLWISGNTYDHKKLFKGLGMSFSGNKKAWYYHEDTYRKRSKKKFSMNDIRDLHGSQDIKTENNSIAA